MTASPTDTLVLDTNTLYRGLLDRGCASGNIIRVCDERIVLTLLSRPVLTEYRRILGDPIVVSRHAAITKEKVNRLLDRLYFVGETVDPVSVRFEFDRDPKDAIFIELAIAGGATHIISHDKDLLSLPTSRTDAGKRFRQRLRGVKVQDAATFVRENPILFKD